MSEVQQTAADSTNAVEQTDKTQTAADTLYADTGKPDEVKADKADDDKVKAKADESTNATEKTEPDAVPEKYEFEVDEDSPLTDDHLDKIAQYAKERGLSQEAAQKIVDLQADTLKAAKAEQISEFKKTTESWASEAKADKEIGGEQFSRNVELAKRVVDRFGSEVFKKALTETGFGNHPELLRTFVRIGQEMGEDRLVVPGATSTKSKSIEDIFYGSGN